MGVKIGNIDVTFKVGSADCAVYLGDTLVYSGGTPTHDYSLDYLTFIAEEDGTFSFNKSGMSYSVDDGATWTELASGGNTPTVSSGDSILWKANGTYGGNFSSTGQFKVQGNAHSLLFGDNFSRTTDLSGNTLINLFANCTGLTSAENMILPATTLANNCYSSMFNSCTSLTTAPELPATTLANYCYRYMFRGCTSLTTAPELPATTLANNCYRYMFRGCTSLTTAPELPATTLATSCYESMFDNCTSLTTVPSNLLPATTLAEDCYLGMFEDCTSLTTAPELPATTLAQMCYSSMFAGCPNLNSITCIATDISANQCTSNWVSGVSSAGTFTKASSMNDWPSGNSGIPSNWTVVDYQE